MKRILSVILIIILLVSCISGCGDPYSSAIKELDKIEINAQKPGNLVSKELIKALEKTEFKKPKNIIYMIGDGMGENIITVTEVALADKLFEKSLQ